MIRHSISSRALPPTPPAAHATLALVHLGMASLLSSMGCASKPKTTLDEPAALAPELAPKQAPKQVPGAKLQLCPGTDPALAAVLSGLELDHAVMDEATGLATASHQTREVKGLGPLFPALQADGWRALTATPVATRANQAPDRLHVTGARMDVRFEPYRAPPGPLFEAVLGCSSAGGYEVLALHDDLMADTTIQFFGVDVVPRGDGDAVTFVHLMFAMPEIMEFSVYSTGWGVGPGAKGAARAGEPMRYGQQVIYEGQHHRSDPLAGSGWYPIDGDQARWRFVVLMGTSGQGEDGEWKEHVTLQPYSSLEADRVSADGGAESWMWLGHGDMPAACGTALHCTSLRETRGGYFAWKDDAPPFDWIAGVWSNHGPALAALEQAGVEPSRGAWLLDTQSWYGRFDAEQGAGEPLPKEAKVLSSLQ